MDQVASESIVEEVADNAVEAVVEKVASKPSNPPPQWLVDFIVWAGNDPWSFITTIFLISSPIFLISGFLAWKLAKLIEQKEKGDKRMSRKVKNKKNLRRMKAD